MVHHNPSTQKCLLDYALHMLGLDPSVPDPLARQRVRVGIAHLHLGGNIDNDIASIFVTSNMADQPNMGVIRTIDGIAVVCREPARAEYAGEFRFQHGCHDSAAHVATAVATDEDHGGMVYIDCSRELRRQVRSACQLRSFFFGERGLLHRMEFFGEEEGLDKG